MKQEILTAMLCCASLMMPGSMQAQRAQQELGRGVVAVANGSNVLVSWRRLAADPENAQYSVYVNGTLLTTTKNLCHSTTSTKVPVNASVTVVCEGREKVPCTPFVRKSHFMRNVFVEINYEKAGSPLKSASYSTKFVWPCDLDGDGEYDYVVDRCPVDGTRNYYVEGYLADGTFLWNIDLGVNEKPCDGQNDNMCAYDIDCDGKGELIVQTSDGSRFWDKAAGTWGKYVMGKTTGDIDGDGIIDYDTQGTRNPPRYMTVVDGMTGAEKASVEFKYDDAYNRTNKASLMGDEYNKHEAHVGIFYHDGIHPAICGEWLSRDTNKAHHYRNCAFAYDFDATGKATNWHQLFMKNIGGAEFHMIRIYDADGDGKDEMSSGAYVMDHDGSTLFNTGISHGDRHRTSDIDPERPGLETFSIQQNAPDMLGMILFDAGTGEPIKKWYLPAVGDVGRGECMDLDPNHLGWEMFSTMDGYQMYDAKGNKIEGKYGFFPTESMWWDGALDRERLDSPDGNGYNAMVVDYTNGRLFEMAKESGWTVQSSYGKRAKYWGDITGDWREEVVLNRVEGGVNTGIAGYSTDIATTVNNIYCLQEDPHYRGDCTTRGYYQTPNPGFYLGYDMPRPQLPPCMVPDDETDVFGIANGDATVTPRDGVKKIYAMPVKGQTLTLKNTGTSIAEGPSTEVWKSQQGTLVMDAAHSGHVYVTEGTVKGTSFFGTVDLRARGTLTAAHVDSLAVEGALNHEGCRLKPEGAMEIAKTVTVPAKKSLYIELTPGNDWVKANFNVKGTIIFTIAQDLPAGMYLLIEGGIDLNPSKLDVRGLKGKSYSFERLDPDCLDCPSQLFLIIHEQREATTGVQWTGTKNTTWDYKTLNFTLDGEETNFVSGDQVEIGDNAVNTTISLPVLYPTGGVTFTGNKKFTVQGDGGFSGEGGLTVDMEGSVTLNAVHSDYTGTSRLLNGTVTVKEITDQGIESSLGAGKGIEMARARLIINNTNSGTNRTVQFTDTATISIASGSFSLKGLVSGNGTLYKAGAGQLNITYAGANQWKETILNAGTLAMGAWNTTFGKASSPIHVTGNSTITIFNNNSTSAVPQFLNVVTIDKGKTLTFHAGQRCAIKGSLKGEGTYKIDFPYVRGDFSTNCSAFEGTLQICASDKGNARFVQAIDLSKGTLQVDDKAYVAGYTGGSGNETSYTHKIGSITGSGTLGTGTWNIGYLGKDDTFTGTFNGAASVGKYGDGTLYLNGTCEGAITVNAGMLAGTGTAKGVTVKNGAAIGAGKSGTTVGTLTLGAALTVASGGRISMRYKQSGAKTTCDALNVAGNVKLTSPVIELTQLGTTELADNAELKLFTGAGKITVTGTVTIHPEAPKQGWKWDTSSLATDGILRIAEDPTAITAVNAHEQEGQATYDLTGRQVSAPAHGIYIIGGKKVLVK